MISLKILKNNYSELATTICSCVYPRKLECVMCGSELEYEEDDMYMGVLGCMHVKCPLCGYENLLDDNENNIVLTKDNIQYPEHFFHTSEENGAVDCFNNEELKKYINRAIEYFRRNKNEFAWTGGSGNTTIHVYRYSGDEEYYVVASNDFYSTYIPFEEEDYE